MSPSERFMAGKLATRLSAIPLRPAYTYQNSFDYSGALTWIHGATN